MPTLSASIDIAIKSLFNRNCTHEQMLLYLEKNCGTKISLSTLKRRLEFLDLRRRNIEESDLDDICYAILLELESCGHNLGYRAMWQKLKYKYGLRVRRDTVAFLLKVADPEGVENRLANRLKRRNYQVPGADFLLHVDGYDKLKPFGFAIHGAIDGFSRCVKWLRCATTNNNPRVTARYFLEDVKESQGVPTMIRADAGGENVIIGSLQRCLRADHDDTHAGSKSFIVGKSTHNQRIEAFWGQLRKHSMNFFIEYFKQMKDDQLYDGSDEDTEILQFCFGPIIQNSLDDSKELWNQHSIRKQTHSTHNGVPFAMYNLPEMWGGKSCKKPVDLAAVDRLMEEFTDDPELFNPAMAEIARRLDPDFETPDRVEDAKELYLKLKDFIRS